MRINIPIYIKTSSPVTIIKDGAYLKKDDGTITWSYSGRQVTGKGIFIATAARSGSMYTTRVLHALGLNIGHECVADDGSVGYHLAVIKPKNCFHQVRHPIKQISSMHAHQSWGFGNDVVDVDGRGLKGCMQYWLKYNVLLEEFCVWRYQIEQFPDVWDEFLERIGYIPTPLPDVPTDTNARNKFKNCKDFTWADLCLCDRQLAQEIEDKAEEYGYEVPQGQNLIAESSLGELVRA